MDATSEHRARIASPMPVAAETVAATSDTARLRREQIVEAAFEIIASQGLHKLSLSQIESRTGMARGHLTYYFPTKEAILLAVFDRMLDRMIEQNLQSGGPQPGTGQAWECVKFMLGRHLQPANPHQQAFGSLLHTFLAQIHYRDDYRAKLAERNEQWRSFMAADFADSPASSSSDPRLLASIVMALVQGLIQQLAVDPHAFDRKLMLETLVRMLAPFFEPDSASPPQPASREGANP